MLLSLLYCHFLRLPSQQSVPMDCAARAGSLKSGTAVAPLKVSTKVCVFRLLEILSKTTILKQNKCVSQQSTFDTDLLCLCKCCNLSFFMLSRVQGNITMRWPAMTRVCVALAGPPVRLPWTWVCSTVVHNLHRAEAHSSQNKISQ